MKKHVFFALLVQVRLLYSRELFLKRNKLENQFLRILCLEDLVPSLQFILYRTTESAV
jgi:hypothetical protein